MLHTAMGVMGQKMSPIVRRRLVRRKPAVHPLNDLGLQRVQLVGRGSALEQLAQGS